MHEGGRNVAFERGARRYAFDPNRIFTDAGALATLRRLNRTDSTVADIDPEVVEVVRRFAEALLDSVGLDTLRQVVALHNNTDEQYSARSYLPGAEYASDAADVHLEPGSDADDFFFVTERTLFDRLRAEGFNVVLQHNAAVTDDGSLSVFAARAGIRYVNVEAQHGHRAEQERMITVLARVLASTDGP